MDKKDWPTTKVNKKFMVVLRALPTDRVSKVKISEGTSQAIGPQDLWKKESIY